MARTHYDLAIIGGGSGGLTAAQIATSLGAKVLLIDRQRLGGDCLNYGCIPSKSLLHVARVLHQARQAERLGLGSLQNGIDMDKINTYIQGAINRVAQEEQSYVGGVTVSLGRVTFRSSTELQLNNTVVTASNIIIATGSHPVIPDIPGLDTAGYLTNEDVFNLLELPASIAIVGAGPIGIEMGQALARLGTRVTIIQRAERILPKEDPEISARLAEILQSEGITIITGTSLMEAERVGEKKIVTVKRGEQISRYTTDELLLAAGREPNVEHLDLAAAGIRYNKQGIQVDDYLRTSTPNIFAIGDVIGGYLFTHVATYQAAKAVRNALFPIGKRKVDYQVVPWCTFCDPEVAHIGLTPAEAAQHGKVVRIVKLPFRAIDRAQTEDETAGFIKLVLSGKKDTIIGAHIIGMGAGELLGELALAMRKKLTINDIYNTIHPYPTINTGIQQAAFAAYLSSRAAATNRRVVSTLRSLRKQS
jgi:pyruvate/2-oxoglutarate dehydrogenase complex dihydrolipoamide dehydrogenase (E3) component